MTSMRLRTWKLSTSVAGISVLLLILGLICVPQKVRANLVSGMKKLAQHLDADLIDRWPGVLDSAKSKRHSGVTPDHAGAVPHFDVTPAQTDLEAASTAFTAAALHLGDGLGKTLFEAEYGSPLQPDSVAALMRRTLQNNYAESTPGYLLDSALGAVEAWHDGSPGGKLNLTPSAKASSFERIEASTVHNLTSMHDADREPPPGPTSPKKALTIFQKPKPDNQTISGFGQDPSRDDSSAGLEQKSAADVGKPDAAPVAAALHNRNSSPFDSAGWQ